MEIKSGNLEVKVFSISPPTMKEELFWKNIQNTISLSEKYDFTGVLIFTGNDAYVDPWLVAQYVISETESLSPLVAVNPIYMHPYAVAKMITSFGYLYGRKTYLNCVTGKAKSDLISFKDILTREECFNRLEEYMSLVQQLIRNTAPVTHKGQYYHVENLHLLPRLAESLFPELYIAGSSKEAREVVKKLGATRISMAEDPTDLTFSEYADQGTYCGVIAREHRDEAWKAAHRLFPENKLGKEVHRYLQDNSNATWKAMLFEKAQCQENKENLFWLKPFEDFQADCPYYVGSYEEVSDVILNCILSGTNTFILDVPPVEEEYVHVSKTFDLVKSKLKVTLEKDNHTGEGDFFKFNI